MPPGCCCNCPQAYTQLGNNYSLVPDVEISATGILPCTAFFNIGPGYQWVWCLVITSGATTLPYLVQLNCNLSGDGVAVLIGGTSTAVLDPCSSNINYYPARQSSVCDRSMLSRFLQGFEIVLNLSTFGGAGCSDFAGYNWKVTLQI